MTQHRLITWLTAVGSEAAAPPSPRLYEALERALGELVGFKLLTVLRVQGPLVLRLHSSQPDTYPAGGTKDLRRDPWLRSMLSLGEPMLSPDPVQVRTHFPDHQAIFAMGCGAVLNVPIRSALGTLGCLNLLHETHHFDDTHLAVARLFAPLLGLAWLAHDRCSPQGP